MDIIEFISAVNPLIGILLILLSIILALSSVLFGKTKIISILKNRLAHADNIIKDLDQQAKLIIKSDIELKLSQQDAEDKIDRLSLIKNLIISSLYTLDKEKLFSQIN